MAPPYSGPIKIDVYLWQTGQTYRACQHGWDTPDGDQLSSVSGASREAVLELLRVTLEREMRQYLEREWPYYVQEILQSVRLKLHDLSEPCPEHG